MYKNKKIAVVIPAYNAPNHIIKVINGLPPFIDIIVVVDDKCPRDTGKMALSKARDDARITVVFHEKNLGVGGATITGYKKAFESGCDVAIKMDSDDQMDPAYITSLIETVVTGVAGYAKGNRFSDFRKLRDMPIIRLIGNSVLSFMVKVCSGYWYLMDPTNGYTAISKDTYDKINFNKIARSYFFETDMLIHLNIYRTVIKDIPIPARYGDEESSLRIHRIMYRFPLRLLKGLLKRFIFRYLIYDFNMASIYTIIGLPMLLWGVIFGVIKWLHYTNLQEATPAGTVMLAVLPLILGTQFVLQAIQIDMQSALNFTNEPQSIPPGENGIRI